MSGGTSFLSNKKNSTCMDKWKEGVGGGDTNREDYADKPTRRRWKGEQGEARKVGVRAELDVLTKTSKTHCLGTVEPF